jgi:7,8-dihydro-6-hydroxymethylpterin-pyrophosphokinase
VLAASSVEETLSGRQERPYLNQMLLLKPLLGCTRACRAIEDAARARAVERWNPAPDIDIVRYGNVIWMSPI